MKINYGSKIIEVTDREAAVWNRLVDISLSGSTGDISDFSDIDSPKAVGGVISSLIKKGLVFAENAAAVDRSGVDIWPCHPEEGPVFWCDYLDESEAKAFLAA